MNTNTVHEIDLTDFVTGKTRKQTAEEKNGSKPVLGKQEKDGDGEEEERPPKKVCNEN